MRFGHTYDPVNLGVDFLGPRIAPDGKDSAVSGGQAQRSRLGGWTVAGAGSPRRCGCLGQGRRAQRGQIVEMTFGKGSDAARRSPDAAAGGAARSFRLTMPAKPIFLAARLTCFCLGVEFLNGVRQASISDRHGCACSSARWRAVTDVFMFHETQEAGTG
jgi:hypothetical protein